MIKCHSLLLSVCAVITAGGLCAETTRIEQNSPNITYTGTWYQNGASPHSTSSAALTNDKDATATLTFTGTAVTWIGIEDPYSGIAQVYLDGTPNTVDTYGPDTKYQQSLFAARGLAPGPHTLSIQVLHRRDGNTSGSWVWIDAFDIENGSGVAGGVTATAGRTEQNDPSVSFNGNWYLNSNPVQSKGTALLATDAGSRATIVFTGTGVNWIAYRDEWSGTAKIYIDGTFNSTVDTYVTPQQPQSKAFGISGLLPGSHSLTIEATGTHSAASAGSWLWIDAFDVIP